MEFLTHFTVLKMVSAMFYFKCDYSHMESWKQCVQRKVAFHCSSNFTNFNMFCFKIPLFIYPHICF